MEGQVKVASMLHVGTIEPQPKKSPQNLTSTGVGANVTRNSQQQCVIVGQSSHLGIQRSWASTVVLGSTTSSVTCSF